MDFAFVRTLLPFRYFQGLLPYIFWRFISFSNRSHIQFVFAKLLPAYFFQNANSYLHDEEMSHATCLHPKVWVFQNLKLQTFTISFDSWIATWQFEILCDHILLIVTYLIIHGIKLQWGVVHVDTKRRSESELLRWVFSLSVCLLGRHFHEFTRTNVRLQFCV